jgi:hypothetical protein
MHEIETAGQILDLGLMEMFRDRDFDNADELFQAADRAKDHGRNRVVRFVAA